MNFQRPGSFRLLCQILQDAVLNPRTIKITTIKTNAAAINPGVPNSSANPVPGKAVVVGWGVFGAPEVANAS